MAFENLFGNINFQAANQAARDERNFLANQLSQGLAMYERGQDRDLRRRQLEMRENQQEKFNLDRVSEEALLKKNMGLPLSPQEEAAIMTRSQTERPQIYTDPLTNQTVVRPSPWATMGSAQQVAQQAPQQAAQMPQRQQAIAAQSDVTQVQPLLMDQPQEVSESPYKAPAELGARGKVMEAESAQRIAEKYAEADYNQKLKMQKERFDDVVMNEGAIPLIDQMIKMNRQTIDAPYADLLQAGTRFLASDQADAFDIVNQNRLELAAPLAKALGVNPTDKDFEASLNRIVNLNSTKSGREKQLQNLRKRTLEKIKKLGGQAKTPSGQERPQITREQALQMLKERGRL